MRSPAKKRVHSQKGGAAAQIARAPRLSAPGAIELQATAAQLGKASKTPGASKVAKATTPPKAAKTTKASSSKGGGAGGKRASGGKGTRSSKGSGSAQLRGGTLFTRQNGFFAMGGLLFWLALIFFYPFSTEATRSLTLWLSAALLLLSLGLFWRVALLRWGVLLLLVGAAVFVSMPGRNTYDRLALRAEFAKVLRRYEGARYCKGGEGVYGIDGPGLVRRASIEAPFLYGVRSVNPWLIRKAFEAWWERDLALGKSPLSRRISKIKGVHGFNDLILYPCDYALLDEGAQSPPSAIAYLGFHEWIVADAERAKVVIVDGRKAGNARLQQAGALYRWRLLEARR